MAYNGIPFKTSRGVAAYVKANLPAGLAASEVLPHKSSGSRTLPNVTILITDFTEQQDNPGAWHVSLIVSIRTPWGDDGSEYASEEIVAAIADLFDKAIGTDRSTIAEAITAAGRALAEVEDTRDGDMANFKVDFIQPLPGATSAAEKDDKSQCWVDDFPFELVVRAVDSTEPEA